MQAEWIGLVGGWRGWCSVADCARLHYARGMCINHYQQWRLAHLPVTVRCSVEGCERRVHAYARCKHHYDEWRRLDPDAPRSYCSVEDCAGPVHARGLCGGHYTRWKRWRDVSHGRQHTKACAAGCGRPAAPYDRWCIECELEGKAAA